MIFLSASQPGRMDVPALGRLTRGSQPIIEAYHAVRVSEDGQPEPEAVCGWVWQELPTEPWDPAKMAKCRECHYEGVRLLAEG